MFLQLFHFCYSKITINDNKELLLIIQENSSKYGSCCQLLNFTRSYLAMLISTNTAEFEQHELIQPQHLLCPKQCLEEYYSNSKVSFLNNIFFMSLIFLSLMMNGILYGVRIIELIK